MSENIEKLPKWAQEHIRKLERDKELAERQLQEWTDSQTPSPFFVEELNPQRKPMFVKRYIQTHKIDIEHNDMEVSIYLRGDVIDISFRALKGGNVYIQPRAANSIYLVKGR